MVEVLEGCIKLEFKEERVCVCLYRKSKKHRLLQDHGRSCKHHHSNSQLTKIFALRFGFERVVLVLIEGCAKYLNI